MTAPASVSGDDEKAWIELGERLRSSREYLGLSQNEVADHVGLSRPAITNMEAGKRKVSTLELKRLAGLYRKPYEYFSGEAPEFVEDETTGALFRTARELTERDRAQVLRFAQFLRNAGPAPEVSPDEDALP
jgi:transcriptional regulator with XRE-family HTH domain